MKLAEYWARIVESDPTLGNITESSLGPPTQEELALWQQTLSKAACTFEQPTGRAIKRFEHVLDILGINM